MSAYWNASSYVTFEKDELFKNENALIRVASSTLPPFISWLLSNLDSESECQTQQEFGQDEGSFPQLIDLEAEVKGTQHKTLNRVCTAES